MKSDSIRCFVAVEVPDSIQDKLVKLQDNFRSNIDNASWIKRGNFHITLKFLGEVDNRRVDEICASLDNVAKNKKPFSIEIGGVGTFPNLVRPHVLWVGLKQGAVPTTLLANAINRELVEIGFPEDTRFHPHFTLARLKRQTNLKSFTGLFEKFESIEGTLITVNKFTLIRSELYSSGAVYTPIKKYILLDREKVDNGK